MKVFNVKLLYIYKFISQCLPIYAFYTILFIQRGMLVNDIAVLVALWSLFSIVFEIPSGVLADRWNRRNMLCLAAILQGLCFVVWYFSQGFFMFAAGFVFWGISGAFASGTEEGLIYDNLKSDGHEENFAKVYGRAQFFANLGNLVGILLAGVLSRFISIDVIALMSAGICFFNAFIVSRLREKNYYTQQVNAQKDSFFSTFRQAGAFLRRSKIALVTILFLVFFASLGSYLDEFDALIINDFKVDSMWVSAILVVRFAFVSVGSLIAPKMQRLVSSVGRVFIVNTGGCACLLVFAIIWHQYAILFFGLSSMLMCATEVLLIDIMQSEIKDEGRATVMSLYGFGQNLFMVGFSLVYAALAGLLALQYVYVILAVYGIIGGLVFYFLCKTNSK